MAAMDRDAIQTYVLDYLGNRADADNAKIQSQINREYKRLALAFRFHEVESLDTSITTVASTETYSLVSLSPRAIWGVWDLTNKNKLDPKDSMWLFARDRSAGTEGVPLYWARFADNLFLHPVPDGAYNIQLAIISLPSDLSAGTDTPVYPEDWHEVIALMTVMRFLFLYGLDMRAMNAKNEALGMISGLVEDEKLVRRFAMRLGQIAVERRGQGG